MGASGTVRRAEPKLVRLLVVMALAMGMTVSTPFVERALAAGPAVTLSVTAPPTTVAGSAVSVTVTARDAAGLVATSYRGRVTFTSTDARSPALPAAYTFTAADNGRHTFPGVRLFTAGTRTVAAFDTVRATVKGRSGPIVVAPATASRLTISAPASATAGVGVTVTVTAKDAWFNVATGYRGTVRFASDDTRAVLPGPRAFTAADRGVHAFPGVQLRTAGTRTITATDSVRAALTTRSGAITVSPGAVTRLAVSAPADVVAGTPFALTVTAKDAYFNVVPGYRGTVAFTSTDPSAAVPLAPYTFTATDRGAHTFPAVRLGRGGGQTVTATDRASAGITGSTARITVAPHLALYGWGTNGSGELGNGTTTPRDAAAPVLVGADTRWASVATGAAHVVALTSDGTLWTWGEGSGGRLGTGTTTLRATPGQVGTDRWVSVAAGYQHTLAVRSDGTLWAWGANDFGQVGDGTTTDRTTPVQVGQGRAWSTVSADEAHSVALARDGSIWVWGLHSGLTVGEPVQEANNFSLFVPTRVGTDTDWTAVDAGSKHLLALKRDGSLWGWGANFEGATGHPENLSRQLAPTRIGTDTDWVTFDAGHAFSFAIKADGSLWGWGWNNVNQLGNGTLTDQFGPAQVVPGAWADVAIGPGAQFTAAVRADGTQWAWGVLPPVLGPPSPPTRIGTSSSWKAVHATVGNVLGTSSSMLP